MAMTLRWRTSTALPVDGSPIRPETFREQTSAESARLRLRVGNSTVELGDLFELEGDAADGSLVVEGDLTHVHRLGRGMASGSLKVRGDVGPQFGAEMSGGAIDLDGSCGDWAGAELRGGSLRIRGDAGNALAAAYPGSRRGMRDGLVLVDGSAGDDVGLMMRRGVVCVRGDVGAGLGRGMIAGTIYACGAVGAMPGLGMKRGTLVLSGLGEDPVRVLSPTFHHAVRMALPILRVYAAILRRRGFDPPSSVSRGEVDRYNGDLAVGGKGEVLVPAPPSS